ncbi:hypothetical protein RCL1_008437 [Eukaryota sp. TZLM3-RCL]
MPPTSRSSNSLVFRSKSILSETKFSPYNTRSKSRAQSARSTATSRSQVDHNASTSSIRSLDTVRDFLTPRVNKDSELAVAFSRLSQHISILDESFSNNLEVVKRMSLEKLTTLLTNLNHVEKFLGTTMATLLLDDSLCKASLLDFEIPTERLEIFILVKKTLFTLPVMCRALESHLNSTIIPLDLSIISTTETSTRIHQSIQVIDDAARLTSIEGIQMLKTMSLNTRVYLIAMKWKRRALSKKKEETKGEN